MTVPCARLPNNGDKITAIAARRNQVADDVVQRLVAQSTTSTWLKAMVSLVWNQSAPGHTTTNT